ncbi:MAG TPA: FCD domain-containing protein [Streptosporangiaceae bacterium]|nr:FCD domain-containing protein [Streptosporangiaceae bacterium]
MAWSVGGSSVVNPDEGEAGAGGRTPGDIAGIQPEASAAGARGTKAGEERSASDAGEQPSAADGSPARPVAEAGEPQSAPNVRQEPPAAKAVHGRRPAKAQAAARAASPKAAQPALVTAVPREPVPGLPAPGIDLGGVLRPVRQGNAFEETVERLLTVIKLGMVGPGERFPAERELAAQLGISRLTLREAIRELHEAGYVSSRRGRFGGTFVTYTRPAPDRSELRRLALQDGDRLADALTFRLAVETGAAEALASQLAGAPEIAVQQTLLARLAGVNGASPQDYRRLDTLFHLSIAELTGSSLLTAACADARWHLNDLLNAIPVLQRNIDHTAGQHQAIVAAILAGDRDGARAAVAEHLDGTAALLRGFLG